MSIRHTEPGVVKIEVPVGSIATEQAGDIVFRIAPEFFNLFLEKNAKYAKVGNLLGAKGVFPDVNRKVGILKDRIWDGNESPGEPTREVMMDMIGHLFLMIHMLDIEEKECDDLKWDHASGVLPCHKDGRPIEDTHLPENKFEAAARDAYLSKSAERAGYGASDDGPNYPSYGDDDEDEDVPVNLDTSGETKVVMSGPAAKKFDEFIRLICPQVHDSEARTSDHIPGRGGW